jgi:hypothetical protein
LDAATEMKNVAGNNGKLRICMGSEKTWKKRQHHRTTNSYAVAKTIDEAGKFVDAGFEFVCDFNGESS